MPSKEFFYNPDLAYIHNAGFGDFAREAGRHILSVLQERGILSGHTIDLGCGSGIWARMLVDAGYTVHGIDLSPAMIDLARTAVPEATFEASSVFDVEIPSCDVVTSLGECLNYLFDNRNTRTRLATLFRRVFDALTPGGLLIFDVIEPGYQKATGPPKRHSVGGDWAVLAHIKEDLEQETLERHVTTFRKSGETYIRREETHRVQLYRGKDLAKDLREIGFHVQLSRSYGDFELSEAHAVLTGYRPAL